MDDIVKQAMAKWPNVPHCYGWLALDARGQWRLCDLHAQSQQSAGERIYNAALLDFINRNYMTDGSGQWYFQNGPQRVYVDLAATPYIARTDPAQGFVLHTGQVWNELNAAWMNSEGALVLQGSSVLALVDDRDLEQCLEKLCLAGGASGTEAPLGSSVQHAPVSDEDLFRWLAENEPSAPLFLALGERMVPVKKLPYSPCDARFGQDFGVVRRPRPSSSD